MVSKDEIGILGAARKKTWIDQAVGSAPVFRDIDGSGVGRLATLPRAKPRRSDLLDNKKNVSLATIGQADF